MLTEGASQGVHLLFNTLIFNKTDAILIPIPQYPLYSAGISLYGGAAAPYYMDEASGWQFDLKELEKSLEASKQRGETVKALVVINPGNPTGSILSKETIKQVIEFSVKNRLVLIADEVLPSIFRSTERISTKRELLLSHSEVYLKPWANNTEITANWLPCIPSQKDSLASAA